LSEQRAASNIIKMLRKLRWMRMEGETKWMEAQSALNILVRGDSILAAPHDSD
jgi:hypothetical protein